MKKFSTLKKNLINVSAASILAVTVAMAFVPGTVQAAATLEAQIESGLPIPAQNTMKSMEQTPYLVTSQIAVSASVEDVASFYRAELAKLNWQEDKGKEVMTAQGGALQFTSPEGPATLTLVNTGSETQVKLALRKAEAARKSGLMPAEGETKVMFGNFMDGEAVININDKSIKVAPHAGEIETNGPTIDMKPGTYTYKVEIAGQEPMVAELVVGSNEIWGLMIDSSGTLPLQMY